MSLNYCAIDGFVESQSAHGNRLWWSIPAILGMFLITAAATKQFHSVAAHLAHPQVSQTVGTYPVGIQTQRFGAPHQFVSQATTVSSNYQAQGSMGFQQEQRPTASFSWLNAIAGPAVFCFAGLATYLWRHDNSMAMATTTGVRQTLSETKLKFLTLCDASIPNMYNIPLQELLAQHHLLRYNTKYQYDEVFALGIVTVINQLLEGLTEAESERIQNAYFNALGDSLAKFKADAAELEKWASEKGKDLNLSGDDQVTQKLKGIAARAASGELQYSKFFSIGTFQLLQLSGQTDPETFTALVNGMNVDKERVTKDLKVYKDLLKKLEMAKDMKEKFLERERKKQQERLAQKAQKAEQTTVA